MSIAAPYGREHRLRPGTSAAVDIPPRAVVPNHRDAGNQGPVATRDADGLCTAIVGGLRTSTEADPGVVAMRELPPRDLAPKETLRWMARLHRAFYVEHVDVTDPAGRRTPERCRRGL